MKLLQSRQPWPLRWYLAALIASALLPVVAFSGMVMLQLASRMRDLSERQLYSAAEAMAAGIDRETSSTVRTLEALAQSSRLDTGDLEGFAAQAERVEHSQPTWLNVVLMSPDGQQLMNLHAPAGAPLGRADEPRSVERTVRTGAPVVGPLILGRVVRTFNFPVRVPVFRKGKLRYVLSAVLSPAALRGAIGGSPFSGADEFTRTVVDENERVVFRTRDPDRFIGQPVSAEFSQHTRLAQGGIFPSTTLDGLASYVAFVRSPESGWVSAVVVPRERLDGPRLRSLLGLVVSGLVALLSSLLLATVFSRRFARGIGAVGSAGEALARGEAPALPQLSIAELNRLGQSLVESGSLMREREQDRDQHVQRAEAAVRARDEFLSLASHELRTPLTSLVLHAQLLQRALDGRADLQRRPVERFLHQTRRQVGRLTRLVDDMLDISRIEMGRLSLDPERVELCALTEEVIQRLGPQLREAGCAVSLYAPEPVEGRWDRYRIDQVLTNVLTNATRYGAGKPVVVSVGRVGEGAELRIRDHGRGIAPEDQERIFHKFERAVDKSEVSGLGLGLFIVREITSMHGGTVRVESALGEGATFVITLPTSASEAMPAGSSAA